jgi:hypothetical protein
MNFYDFAGGCAARRRISGDIYLCEITTTETVGKTAYPVCVSRETCCEANCQIYQDYKRANAGKERTMYYILKKEAGTTVFKAAMYHKDEAEHHIRQLTKRQEDKFMVIKGKECELVKQTVIIEED